MFQTIFSNSLLIWKKNYFFTFYFFNVFHDIFNLIINYIQTVDYFWSCCFALFISSNEIIIPFILIEKKQLLPKW